MTVCIDTNVLVQMFGRLQRHWAMRDALAAGRFKLAVSNEILLEHEEIITKLAGATTWQIIQRQLAVISRMHASILFIEPHFRFCVVATDPDDNKFVDCAIAAQADFIVTSDRHFDALLGSGYKPQPITPEEFVRRHC